MASLNTLRTKFGVVLSIVIGLALLAFVLSLRTEMGFSGNDPEVGAIDGNDINYSEFYRVYEEQRQQNEARFQNLPEQQRNAEYEAAFMVNSTWGQLLAKYVFNPGMEDLGLKVTDDERRAVLRGEFASQALMGFFQQSGYTPETLGEFLAMAESNPQLTAYWNGLNQQIREERMMMKYFGLVKNGVYANSLEVADGVKNANTTYSGKWIGKPYTSVADSLIQVSEADLKAYYEAHKRLFRQLPNRTLTYVSFDVVPTDEDLMEIRQEVETVGKEFKEAKDVRAYTNGNMKGQISQYISAQELAKDDRLTGEEVKNLLKGKTYGPELKNNEWTMIRVLDAKTLPETFEVSYLSLSNEDKHLVDSIQTSMVNLSSEELASTYGAQEASFRPMDLTEELIAALENAKVGDVKTVDMGNYTTLLKVNGLGDKQQHIRLASIVYPEVASNETFKTAEREAGTFLTMIGNSQESFDKAVESEQLTPRVVTVAQNERMLGQLPNSRELVRWAHGADKGHHSTVLKMGDSFVVAILTDIDEEEYVAYEKVAERIRPEVIREKKYAFIKETLVGGTFQEQAQSLASEQTAFEGLNLATAPQIEGVGFDSHLMGAIAATTETNQLSAPVMGERALYVFTLDKIDTQDKQTVDAERVKAQAAFEEQMNPRMVNELIYRMANVEDLTGEYF